MLANQPLAERLRPVNLDSYFGQEHLVGTTGVLRKMLENRQLPSIILWGPPGVGKTTLARIFAEQLKRPFYSLSAINSGVKDVRETIEKAKKQRFFDQAGPVLFIDEIHRFSKSQQDSLLGAVEQGIVTLIGATTENPSFEVISPLLSRCQVYVLKSIGKEDLIKLAQYAIQTDYYLKQRQVTFEEWDALLLYSGGDARKLLNTIELLVSSKKTDQAVIINNKLVEGILQENLATYDKNGEMHYDIISAFIKSIRGSAPDAAVYWLARMIEGGEDLKFIARRLLILSAEDIGLANPNALLLAQSTFQAVSVIGYPESRIILSELTIYLATSAKSNSAYLAINQAQELVKKTGNLPVPLHLRNAPTKLLKDLNYGGAYKYAHDYPDNFVKQEYLPDSLQNTTLYQVQSNASEDIINKRQKQRWDK